MATIEVSLIDNNHFQVTVIDQSTTSHHVTLQDQYANKLLKDNLSRTTLVKKSFEFLLQREPNTSILRNFDLSVIANYFPEYEATINNC
ncbi:MAG TPA: hypothetical protein DCO68_02235 [Methylophilaceae bacterium]|nr:hypothetical protein [Methylophilaceae bacterium]HAJ70878.1 hypothetical protein [Methylophilaceae bacterium]